MVGALTLNNITDAPDGYLWKCPDCDSWSSLKENVFWHLKTTGHKHPSLLNQEVYYESKNVLLVTYWRRDGQHDYNYQNLVECDTSSTLAPTPKEMQRIMGAAKMEWAKCIKDRNRKSRRNKNVAV